MQRKGKTVLVVEDERLLADLEADILEDGGYDAQVVTSGDAAIASLGTSCPDLVVLDIVMPGIDGWDVLRFIRTLPNPPRVIVATGLGEVVPPDPLGGLVAGYVYKPFRPEGLLKTCDDVLATPPIAPPLGGRKESRRTYVVEATLLSPTGAPLINAQLVQVSRGGFRLAATGRLQAGQSVSIAFRIPGRDQALQVLGTVRWRSAEMIGVQAKAISTEDEDLLRSFVEADVEGMNGASYAHAPELAAV
jgi:two-component system OmpR family response regulator